MKVIPSVSLTRSSEQDNVVILEWSSWCFATTSECLVWCTMISADIECGIGPGDGVLQVLCLMLACARKATLMLERVRHSGPFSSCSCLVHSDVSSDFLPTTDKSRRLHYSLLLANTVPLIIANTLVIVYEVVLG